MSLNKRYIKLIQGYSQDYDIEKKGISQSSSNSHSELQTKDLVLNKKESNLLENPGKKHKNTVEIELKRKNKFLEAIRLDENECFYDEKEKESKDENNQTNSEDSFFKKIMSSLNPIPIKNDGGSYKIYQIKDIFCSCLELVTGKNSSKDFKDFFLLFSNFTQKEDLLFIFIATYLFISEYVLYYKDIILQGLSVKELAGVDSLLINDNNYLNNKENINHIDIGNNHVLNIKHYISLKVNNTDIIKHDHEIKETIAKLNKFYYDILSLGKFLNCVYEKEVLPLISLYFPTYQSRFCLLKITKTIFLSYLLYDVSIILLVRSSYSSYFINYAREMKTILSSKNEYLLMKNTIEEYLKIVFVNEYETTSKKEKKSKNRKNNKNKEKEKERERENSEEICLYENMLKSPIFQIYDFIKNEGCYIYFNIMLREIKEKKDSKGNENEKEKENEVSLLENSINNKKINKFKVCDCSKKDKENHKNNKDKQCFQYFDDTNDNNHEMRFKDIDEIVDFINSNSNVKRSAYDKVKSKSKMKSVSVEKKNYCEDNEKNEDDKEVELFIERLIKSSCHMENVEKLTVN